MKHFANQLSTFAVLIVGILLFSACDDKETTLELSPHHLVFNADDTTEKSVAIETDATEWSYRVHTSNWLDVYTKPGEFKKLFIRTHKNSDVNGSRVAFITVSAGKTASVELSVEQLKKETNDLSVSQDHLDFNMNETGQKRITIDTDAPVWEAFTNAPWIKLEWIAQTLTVTVTEANPLGYVRSADIVITAGNALPLTITVTQGATVTLAVSPPTLSFLANGTGTQAVTVTTNVSGWVATSAAPWLTLTQSNNLLTVSASPNTTASVRYATITVTADGQVRTISVTQAAGAVPTIATRTYYRATGIQLNENLEFDASWTGEIIPNNSLPLSTVTITNWSGNWGPNIWCNYVDGKYRLDITSKIGDDTDDIHAGYMCMGTYNLTTKEIRLYPGVGYDVNYNAVTKVFDFSGTYNGLPTCIAMVAKNKNSGQWNTNRTYFNIYTNLKLELISTYSAEPQGNTNPNPPSGLEGRDISKNANVKIILPK